MNPVYNVLVYAVWFLSTYFVVVMMLTLFTHLDKLYEKRPALTRFPAVTVIVPAYNEAGKIGDTIASLKNVVYPLIQYIIVNDGSKDSTSAEVRAAIGTDGRFTFIDREVNKGKAASLNEGIAQATGEFVACMDADSIIEEHMFQKVLPYFDDGKVGAVTVTVELRHPKTILHKIIDIEYTIGLSLFLKVYSLFNCVFVTPGPFSMYRKSLLDAIGGFDVKSIVEDHEIAFRVHKAGYTIANCLEAKVMTITPPTFHGIYVQRRRWYSGSVHTLFQHADVVFNKRFGVLGVFLPFNYLLIGSGIILFYLSTYLSLKKFYELFQNYWYIGFDAFDHLFRWNMDVLRTSQISIIGYIAFFSTIIVMVIGMLITGKSFREKLVGVIGFPFMFFLYQIYWSGAIWAVIRRKTVKWR